MLQDDMSRPSSSRGADAYGLKARAAPISPNQRPSLAITLIGGIRMLRCLNKEHL